MNGPRSKSSAAGAEGMAGVLEPLLGGKIWRPGREKDEKGTLLEAAGLKWFDEFGDSSKWVMPLVVSCCVNMRKIIRPS